VNGLNVYRFGDRPGLDVDTYYALPHSIQSRGTAYSTGQLFVFSHQALEGRKNFRLKVLRPACLCAPRTRKDFTFTFLHRL